MNEIPTPNTFPALFAGYSALWIILSLFILRLGIKLSRIEREQTVRTKDESP